MVTVPIWLWLLYCLLSGIAIGNMINAFLDR